MAQRENESQAERVLARWGWAGETETISSPAGMLKRFVRQGRNERNTESTSQYVEALSDVRTTPGNRLSIPA